jgi:hypothetical protein
LVFGPGAKCERIGRRRSGDRKGTRYLRTPGIRTLKMAPMSVALTGATSLRPRRPLVCWWQGVVREPHDSSPP